MGADQASGLEESLHLRIQIRPTYTPPSSLVGLHHHLVLQMSDAATWDYHPGSAGRNSVCQGRVLVTSPSHPPSQSDSLIIHGVRLKWGSQEVTSTLVGAGCPIWGLFSHWSNYSLGGHLWAWCHTGLGEGQHGHRVAAPSTLPIRGVVVSGMGHASALPLCSRIVCLVYE